MRHLTPFLFVSTLLAVAVVAASFGGGSGRAQADPFASLEPGTWYEVPNSHLQEVVPVPTPPGTPSAIMAAWSGGAYDILRDRLLVSGGGHGDYGGNEVYAFDIGTLSWSRVWGPSPIADIQAQTSQACVDTYADGNPVSRHTYDNLEYLPNQDRFWLHGGSRYCGSGGFGYDTWTLDLTTPAWTRQADRSDLNRTLTSTAYDPASGHMLVQAYNRLMEYDPDANSWSQRGSYGPGLGDYYTAAYDPIRKIYVLVGNGNVRYYDLSVPGIVNLQSVTTTGNTDIVALRYPGLEYDPVADRIVAWSGGADVYTLSLDTWVWTKHAPAVGNTVTPTAPTSTGTNGRFRYIPSKNAYIAVNAIDQNVYLYKLPQITRVDLPLQTWIARSMPADGEGPCPFGCKHMRIAHNPTNGRLYVNGGDYSGGGWPDSGRNETYSYSIADGDWRQEFPYCAPLGQYQPGHPDEVGWAFDTTRNLFWMVPGYMGQTGPGNADGGLCLGWETQMVRYQMMTFDPSIQTWGYPSSNELTSILPSYTLGNNGFVQYDAATDSLIQFLYTSFAKVALYHIATDTWEIVNLNSDANLSKEYTAFDSENRLLYVMDGYRDTFYRYHLDTQELELIGNLPDDATYAQTHIVWDSSNRVVHWARWDGTGTDPVLARYWVYHPDTNTWEQIPTTLSADGGPVFGNHLVYDPFQNVVLLMGGVPDSNRRIFFLYRYGNGVGMTPPAVGDSIAPAAVNNLTAS